MGRAGLCALVVAMVACGGGAAPETYCPGQPRPRVGHRSRSVACRIGELRTEKSMALAGCPLAYLWRSATLLALDAVACEDRRSKAAGKPQQVSACAIPRS